VVCAEPLDFRKSNLGSSQDAILNFEKIYSKVAKILRLQGDQPGEDSIFFLPNGQSSEIIIKFSADRELKIVK